MLAGPPLPLLPTYPLSQLIGLLPPVDLGRSPREGVGVWLRGVEGATPMLVAASGRAFRLLLSGDLGLLLSRCSHVAVRDRWRARVLTVEALIGWRALQVITGTSCLPSETTLQQIFPAIVMSNEGFCVPTEGATPEAVLAECLRRGILVTESRIVYNGGDPALS